MDNCRALWVLPWYLLLRAPANMLCIFCPSGHVESEYHVLMLCNRYSDVRANLFHVAKPPIVNFDNLVVNYRFIAILESQQPSLIQQLAKCI